MARIDWIEARLQNWARWVASRGVGNIGYAGVNWSRLAEADAGRDGYITSSIPTLAIEAADTGAAVIALPSELRSTVECYYLGWGTMREKLARLHISEDTLYRRVDKAHARLAHHWAAKRDQQQAERDRLEALQRQAVPRGFYTAG